MKRFFSLIILAFFLFSMVFPIQKTKASSTNTGKNAKSYLDELMADLIEDVNSDFTLASVPTVSVSLNPSNPEDGNKVQATATPLNFKNSSSSLYYTWFLKRADCPENKSECDLNGDGRVNIEDYKIEAGRNIANGGFDWGSVDYSERGETENTETGEKEATDSNSDSGYKAGMGGDGQSATKCSIYDPDSGVTYRLDDCGHLFADEDIAGEELGDGSFNLKEEKLWHTDPNDPDTANRSQTDEASAVGLGATSITWTYETGDKIGVAVEGIASGSTHAMWALSRGNCNVDDYLDDGDFSMKVSDLNDCLMKNMTSVKEGTDSSDLVDDDSSAEDEDISITYTPDNPYNDPTGEDPVTLTLDANVLDVADTSRIYYDWKVYGSSEKDPESWGDPILKSELVNASASSGYNVETYKFDLAFEDTTINYLKIKVTIKETDDEGKTTTRYKSIVIGIGSVSDKVRVFSTSVDSDASPGKVLDLGDEKCKDTTSADECAVIKDEITGLKISSTNLTEFSWTVDGENISYPLCPLEDCFSTKNNEAYVPILKDAGEIYNISVSAIDKTTQKTVTLSKTLKVVDPYAIISSEDTSTCQPEILGYYIDSLTGVLTPDYSKESFQALPGATIKLNPGLSVAALDYLTWTIDKGQFTKETASQFGVTMNDDGSIEFPADTQVGYSFDVSLSAYYTPGLETRKVLNKYWKVPAADFYEKQLSAKITIEIVECIETADSTVTVSQKDNSSKVLAAIASSLPSQLIFLVKLVLLSALLLFSSYFLLSFFSLKDNG